MKKLVLRFIAALACVLLTVCAACAEGSKPSLTIDTGAAIMRDLKTDGNAFIHEELSRAVLIYKGKSVRLTGTLENVQTSPKSKLTWESSNPAVATVKDGTVTGINGGTATITCSTSLEDGTRLKASVPVAVEIPVASLSTKSKAYSVYRGYSLEPVELIFKPDNATCKTVSWRSADESVATVDQNGVIKGVKEGKTKITAVSDELTSDKQTPKAVTFTVDVLQPSMEKAAVSWDLESDQPFRSVSYFSGYDEPINLQLSINGLTIRELDNGRMEMTFTFQKSIDSFLPTDEQIKKIVKTARMGQIGGDFGFCVADYTTGLDLEEKNPLGVECTGGEWIYGGEKKHTASDGSWISFYENATKTVTVTWPSGYRDLCIGIFGHNTAFNSKNDEAFWKGNVPYYETDYYFKGHPEYMHFMKVNESAQFPGSISDE